LRGARRPAARAARRAAAATLAAALALVAGCGARASQRGPQLTAATADRVIAAVREPGADAVLVNVWATWCIPCREEFPDLVRIQREYRDRRFRMVLVSADFDDTVPQARAFLARHGVDFPSYQKTGDDMVFINTLDSLWSGALPATFLYDGAGRKVRSWEGRQSYETLSREVRDLLEKGRGS
jgi:thiol-disulfide isomerase/thioredoxin